MFWLVALFGLLVVAALAAGIVLYVRYGRSPQKTWRDRVLQVASEAQQLAADDHEALQSLPVKRRGEELQLRDATRQALLKGVPVDRLETFPGIGPATVARLRTAGYADLAALQRMRAPVNGLGAKRLTDVQNAVRHLLRETESQLNSSAGPEAEALAQDLRQVSAQYDDLEVRLRARLQAARAVLASLRSLVAAARRITFLRFLWLERDQLLDPNLLTARLPAPAQAIQAAEDRVVSALTQKRSSPRAEPVVDPSRPSVGVQAISAPARGKAGMAVSGNSISSPSTTGAPPVADPSAIVEPADPRLPLVELVEAAAQFLFAVTRLAGRLTPDARSRIEKWLLERGRADGAFANRIKGLCALYEASAIDLEECLRHAARHLGTDTRREVFALARQLGGEPDRLNKRAARFLRKAAQQLDLPWSPPSPSGPNDSAAKTATPSAPSSPAAAEDPRTILEIDPTVALSADLVRRQYHLLAERYAAQKFASAGPEFVSAAQAKAAAVEAAARSLLADLGERFEPQPPPAKGPRDNPDLDAAFGG